MSDTPRTDRAIYEDGLYADKDMEEHVMDLCRELEKGNADLRRQLEEAREAFDVLEGHTDNRIAELERELEKAKKDSERLDWLASNRSIPNEISTWPPVDPKDLRESIDAARKGASDE